MDKQQIWNLVLERLSDKISRMEFHTWFKKVRLKEISGAAALISCPTEMNRNWLETRWHNVLLGNIQAVVPEVNRLFYEVDLSLADKPNEIVPEVFSEIKKPRKLPNRPEVRYAEGLESRLVQEKFTLENFVVGEENRFAHAAAVAVSEAKLDDPKKYNPLYIYGGVGLGKTHLLQGIANEVLRRNPQAKIIYTTAERFTNEIITAIKERKADGLRKKYRKADFLLIDDVQFFSGKEQTQLELFNTFNDLRDLNKQIVFSGDRPPAQLVDISDRLTSRLGWGLTVDVQIPNFETKLAILQGKMAERQLLLPLDVQEFIATNIRRNLRELENILNKIAMEQEISGLGATVQSVGKILRSLNPDEVISPTGKQTSLARNPDDIITVVSDYFQVPATDLLGTSRKKELVFPRQICWLLCKSVLNMSFDSIGESFEKNHTTIMHGVNKIQKLMREDSATTRHVQALKKDLGVRS